MKISSESDFKNLITKLILLFSPTMTLLIIVPHAQTETTKKAMTWSTLKFIKTWDQKHSYALVGSDSSTNPYQGDTSITTTLPILCIKKSDLPKPSFDLGTHTTPGGASRATWSGGYIGFTKPVKGTILTSATIANRICEETFGSDYRMAQFHDGDPTLWSGWDFWGELITPSFSVESRFWVSIKDQPANPWN